ncbi:MAG: MmgE/PrpD family protein [Bacilli bacterium]|nr:MmgE/PrpD family protein [Bacilli bacterium]
MRDGNDHVANDIRVLCEWARGLQFEHLPEDVIRRAKWVLLDDIGAILGGSMEPEVSALREAYLAEQTMGRSTVLSKGFPKTNRFTAAELNGTAGCWLELDEGYRLATSHAGIYTIPALIALAEEKNASMKEVLTALVVGYEFGARFAEAWVFPPLVLHPHGVFVTIAAAAACAKLQDYGEEQLFKIISTASALTMATPYDHAIKGALVRNLWTGAGARLGLLACEVSKSNVYGLDSSAESVFSTIYGGNYKGSALTDQLGSHYAISSGYHKAYACCQYAHSALDALLSIRKTMKSVIDADHLPVQIIVKTHPKGLSLNNMHPETTLGSKFSMQHAISAAWVLGNGGKNAFTNEALNDPVIRCLRERIVLEPVDELGPPPMDRPAKVKVVLKGSLSEEAFAPYATGDPTKPFDENMMRAKFADTVNELLSQPDEISEFILHQAENETITEFLQLLVKRGK